jgi:hypothetical protein
VAKARSESKDGILNQKISKVFPLGSQDLAKEKMTVRKNGLDRILREKAYVHAFVETSAGENNEK